MDTERTGSVSKPAVAEDNKYFGQPEQGQFLAECPSFFFSGLKIKLNTCHASQTLSCKKQWDCTCYLELKVQTGML